MSTNETRSGGIPDWMAVGLVVTVGVSLVTSASAEEDASVYATGAD